MLPCCPYCGSELESLVVGGTLNPAKLYEYTEAPDDVISVVQECACCRILFRHKVTVEVDRIEDPDE